MSIIKWKAFMQRQLLYASVSGFPSYFWKAQVRLAPASSMGAYGVLLKY